MSRVKIVALVAIFLVVASGGGIWLRPAPASPERKLPHTIPWGDFYIHKAEQTLDGWRVLYEDKGGRVEPQMASLNCGQRYPMPGIRLEVERTRLAGGKYSDYAICVAAAPKITDRK